MSVLAANFPTRNMSQVPQALPVQSQYYPQSVATQYPAQYPTASYYPQFNPLNPYANQFQQSSNYPAAVENSQNLSAKKSSKLMKIKLTVQK